MKQDDDSKDAAAFRAALAANLPTKVCACCNRRHIPADVTPYRYWDLQEQLSTHLAKNGTSTPDCPRDGNTLWVPPTADEAAALLRSSPNATSVPGM